MAFRTNKTPVLQEKTASGSVASFNTVLAMPLVSCNIAVNAWQEGSGDPSPVNDRPIHGFSEVNATRCGVNTWSEDWELGDIVNTTGATTPSSNYIRSKDYEIIKPSTQYRVSKSQISVFYYDANKTFINRVLTSYDNQVITTPSNACFFKIKRYGTTYGNDISLNYPSTQTGYIAYTGNIYTIQLGQEVYGAEVDVVNGVAHVDYIAERIDHVDTVHLNYIKSDACDGFVTLTNCPNISSVDSQYNLLCNVFERVISADGIWSRVGFPNMFQTNGKQLHLNIANDLLGITDYTQETTTTAKAKMNEWLSNNIVMLNRPLLTPFDIQLTPTQIETLIGNNTIFADTGDIDLTYNDLDIAKRGSFREVFKLP